MRRLELRSELPASAQRAWDTFLDVGRWPEWGRLVVSAEGELLPGHRWTMRLRGRDGPSTMRPYFVSMTPPHRVVFETRLGPGWAVTMQHSFEFEATGPERCTLHQRFEAWGLLVRPLWRWLHPGMLQFDQLGADLAEHLRGRPGDLTSRR
jgi:uncharacterized protein YndB with AHSA1/START domain